MAAASPPAALEGTRAARLLRDRQALRALAGVLAMLVLAVIVIVSTGNGAGAEAPATGAAAVVPADTLAYVHFSIDPARPEDNSVLAIAERFPDFPLLREGLLARLSATASASTGRVRQAVDFARDIRPWLGKEAALAVLNTTTSIAGSLIVLDISDRNRARSFLARFAPVPQPSYQSTQILRFGTATETAFVNHYLVIGHDADVRAAIDAAGGRSPSLESSSEYQRATAGEPNGRAIDAYASVDGVRRLLAPQGGIAGALGALLYQPALDGVSVALTPQSGGVAVRVHSALDQRLAKVSRGGAGPAVFSPSLPSSIPAGAILLLDLTHLDQVAPKLLGAGAAGGVGGGVLPLLKKLGAALAAEGVNVQRDILSIFHSETVVAIVPTGVGGRPALLIIARAPNEQRTRSALATLEVPLAQLFPPPGNGPGQATVFNDRQVDGITAHQLSLAAGLQLDYAVFGGKVVISTSLAAIAGVRTHARSIVEDSSYRAALGAHPQRLTSLLFLDFSQLLSLGEQTGLTRSAQFRALRADLQKVRAIGLSSTTGEADSTAELFLQIP